MIVNVLYFQAAHEAQISSQYQNMSLPPSLVQAAASNKNHLHQQALANLNMRESAMAVRGGGNIDVSITSRENFSNASILTPPQTPGSTPWKSSSNGSSGLVVIPEPHKASSSESRHLNNRHSSSSYSISAHDTLANGSTTSSSRSGMRQAVELKSSQPIFPGQPPPLARVASESKSSYNSPQPPPRQSSQPPSRSSTNNRTAFPGLQPPAHDFREPYQHHSELIIQR